MDECLFLPPVPTRPKLLTARGNSALFTRHIRGKLPKQPVLDCRYTFNTDGHNARYALKNVTTGAWNLEIAAVIGRETGGVTQGEALSHVFGYTMMLDHSIRLGDYPFANDWSMPDSDKQMMDYFYEGCFNGNSACPVPLGPVITTRDEIPDPHALMQTERESGRLVSHISTDSVLITFSEIISYISSFITLRPGDMLSSASIAYDGYPYWDGYLGENAYIEGEIAEIGRLRLYLDDERGAWK